RCVKMRYDAQIRIPRSETVLDPLLPMNRSAIRWTGWLKAPRRGRYTLRLDSAGAARLWLDDHLRIDCRQAGLWKHEVEVELTGQPQALRVEYWSVVPLSGIGLGWAQADGF